MTKTSGSQLQKFNELKAKVQEIQREKDRAQGVLEQLKRELESEFGCNTIKDAKSLLKTLSEEEAELEEEYDKAFEEFETAFADALRGRD